MLIRQPQWLLSLIFVSFGIMSGLIIGIIYAINILTGNKKVLIILTDSIKIIAITIVYLIIINLFNYGEHRIYLIISYLCGIFVERKTLGKLFAKVYYKLYNLIIAKLEVLSKSKIGIILKR